MATGGVEGKKERWGTWEELVLAFAVKRHGTKSWDFVAAEVQTRTSVRFVLSPTDCLGKYRDLERRFGSGGDGEKEGEEEEDGESERRIPWLEELRKIRVEELRREVERYDVSIVSLQLKLKKLKEDQKRTASEAQNSPVKQDPEKAGCREDETSRSHHEEGNHHEIEEEGKVEPPVETNGTDPETKPSDPERLINDSTLENRSFNESNSTDEKPKQRGPEPDRLEEHRPDPSADRPGAGERSYGGPTSPSESFNGSSETITKDPSRRTTSSPEGRPTEIGDVYSATKEGFGPSNECSAESKDLHVKPDDTKDSSEGQSSVRPSKRRRTGLSDTSVGGDERDSETASAGVSQVPPNVRRSDAGGIQRLIDHLDTVRSHRYGRVFERRLDSQDSNHYRSLIRKHVDLATVGERVEEGHYASVLEFIRDLLIIINNALVFFPKSSPESGYACKLRELVRGDMMPTSSGKTDRKEEPSPASDTKEETKPTLEVPDSQPSKPSVPLPVVSRKRGNLSISQSSEPPVTKAPKVEPETINHEESERAQRPEPGMAKELEKETKKPVPVKGSRTNKRRATNLSAKNNVESAGVQNANLASNTSRSLTAASATVLKDAGGQKPELPSKKRSAAAANFLNRMKRNGGPSATESTSAAGSLLESLKKLDGGDGGKGVDQRKGRKEPVGRQKQTKSPPAPPPPRKVGRPPKKGPAAKQRASKEVVVATPPPAAARTARKRARR